MPRKHPLPPRQLEIGQRFKAIRQKLRRSRADIQVLAGISQDTCRNIEVGRAPLGYNTAQRVLMFTGTSALWLATGQGPQKSNIPMPNLKDLGLPEDRLFIEVFDHHLRHHWVLDVGEETQAGQLTHISRSHHLQRWFHANNLTALVRNQYLPRVPGPKLAHFERALRRQAEMILAQYPATLPEELLERRTALAALDSQYQCVRPRNESSNQSLTPPSESCKEDSMQSELQSLIARAKVLTRSRGTKATLAAALDVPQPRISEWFAGKYEPSGETTLKLLHWVKQQEAQQNQSPGSVSAPPGPKTRVRTSNEKKSKSSPPKP